MVRAVLDANVIVSGTISPDGQAGKILDAWRRGEFIALASDGIIAEALKALGRPELLARYNPPLESIEELVQGLRAASGDPPHVPPIHVVRDPNDNIVLEAALAFEADVIVTKDNDLLALQSYEGVAILSLRNFSLLLGHPGLSHFPTIRYTAPSPSTVMYSSPASSSPKELTPEGSSPSSMVVKLLPSRAVAQNVGVQ